MIISLPFASHGNESAYVINESTHGNESTYAIIENLDEAFDLGPYIEYIEDVDHSISYEDIQGGAVEHLWRLNEEPVFIGRNIKSRYWFRVNLRFSGDLLSRDAVLAIPSHAKLLSLVSFWLPEVGSNSVYLGTDRQVVTGSNAPVDSKDIDNIRYGFRLPINSLSYTVLGWMDNSRWSAPALMPLTIQSPKKFYEDSHTNQRIMIAFYAIMLTQLIYNICLFLSLREPLYGVYCLAVISGVVCCAVIDGSSLYWFPSISSDSNIRILRVTSILMVLFNLVFIWMSLDRFRFSSWLQHCFKVLMIFAVISLIHSSFTGDSKTSSLVFICFYGLSFLFSYIALFVAISKGHAIAGYLLVAQSLLMAGVNSLGQMNSGVLPLNSLTLWGAHWGYVGETLLLALVLAARTRLLQTSALNNLKKYEILFDDSFEGRFVFSVETEVVKFNDAFSLLLGFEVPLNSKQEMQRLVGRYGGRDMVLALTGAKEYNNYEMEWKNIKTNHTVWVSISSQIQVDSKGVAITVEGAVVDITERKLKERAQQQKAIMEAQAQAKSQFFASMSHELRTPLNVVLGYAEIAKHKDIGEEKRIRAVETIEHSGKHLLTLINDVLDLSKIEAQKIDMEILNVSIVDIVRDVDEFVCILAAKKNISFNVDIQYPVPEIIQSDPTRLKQILINLCDNAIKFTDEGEVRVEVRCDPQAERIEFVVTDTGIGLTQEQINNLFGAFIQADESITRNFGGTGLGLHLSKQLAQLLGGDITVESEFGKGSVFTLTFGIGEVEKVQWMKEPPVSKSEFLVEPPRLIGRVLYVEDNYQNQMLVAEFVGRTGCHMDIANNGQEGLALTRINSYDLVFTDINMPIMDGMEFARQLSLIYPGLPVVSITANTTLAGLDAVGFREVLAKPISSSTLYRVLADYLEEQLSAKRRQTLSELSEGRVLIVDDDKNFIEILSSYLSPYVQDICVAADGEKAIRLINETRFHMVVTDFKLPKMSGVDVICAVKGSVKNNKAKVICITGSTLPNDIEKIYSSGVDLYLTKPISSDLFVDSLCLLFEGNDFAAESPCLEGVIDLKKWMQDSAGCKS